MMSKKKMHFLAPMLLLFFGLTTVLSGCLDRQATASIRANTAARGEGDIVIGAAWPFASNDGGFWQGVELAVNEINSGGGVNSRQLRLVKADDEGNVTKGEAVAQSLAEQKEIVAVIGDRNSFVSLPAAEIYERAGIVMLTPGSTAPELTQKGYQYVFRSIPSDSEIAARVAQYAAGKGHKRMVIYYVDDSYGRGLANAFEDSAERYGLTIVDRIAYYGDLKDLAELKRQWQVMGYDGVFIADSLPRGGEFVADARRVGIDAPFYGGNALDSSQLSKVAGQAAEGMVVGSIFNPNSTRPETQQFVQAFRNKYGSMPSQWSAQGYDAVKLLAAAMTQAKSSEPEKIARQLRTLQNWPGATGIHKFDGSGDEKGDMVVLKTLKNGIFE